MRIVYFGILGLILGTVLGFWFLEFSPKTLLFLKSFFISPKVEKPFAKQSIGFLPYWLVEKAKEDYSDTISTLTYFGLTIGTDGKIQYLANEAEEEPGWHMLKSKKFANIAQNAKQGNISLSLLVFSGNAQAIDQLISNPTSHAKNLVKDVTPLMKKYGFSDLNLDIESTRTNASDAARKNFTYFVQEVKNEMNKENLGTLTIEITGSDLIRNNLINPKEIGRIADYVVIMAYDFHYAGSLVTGPVAPIGGAESTAEFDTNVVLRQAYKVIPKEKIILGVPSYGYAWETINDTPGAAVMPGSGLTMSNKRTEEFLKMCASCSALVDKKAFENYIIYKDQETGTFKQIYYPDKNALQKKVDLIMKNNLAGIAIWALGYESDRMYDPVGTYTREIVDITRL